MYLISGLLQIFIYSIIISHSYFFFFDYLCHHLSLMILYLFKFVHHYLTPLMIIYWYFILTQRIC